MEVVAVVCCQKKKLDRNTEENLKSRLCKTPQGQYVSTKSQKGGTGVYLVSFWAVKPPFEGIPNMKGTVNRN